MGRERKGREGKERSRNIKRLAAFSIIFNSSWICNLSMVSGREKTKKESLASHDLNLKSSLLQEDAKNIDKSILLLSNHLELIEHLMLIS